MKFIMGKKLDMSQVWQGEEVVAVTKLQAGPCLVVQVKTGERDGYSAVQLGYGERQEKNIKKPQKKHMKGLGNFRYLREFVSDDIGLKEGDRIEVGVFKPGDKVHVSSISKGKGFQGVVKRYGFKGQSKTHGTKDQLRMPGSAGATGPAHVFKGQKMPGRMGGNRVTVKNLEVIDIDEQKNILVLKGAVPGARNGLVLISGDGELKVTSRQITEKKDKIKAGKEDNIQKTVEEAKEKVDNKKVEDKKQDEVKEENSSGGKK